MGLSGLDIYKLLPKTNCRKCNFPTCLAFALALAKKSTDISKCPFLSLDAKMILESASQPPIKLITVGVDEQAVVVGNETVLFRHEEKFHHPAGLGLIVEDSDAQLLDYIKFAKELQFERVGQKLHLELIALKNTSKNAQTFAKCVKLIKENCSLNIVLQSDDPESIQAALEICKDSKPLIFGANNDNFSKMAELASSAQTALVVSALDLENLTEVVKKIKETKLEDLVLHIDQDKLPKQIENLTQIRRLALKRNFRPLGYPVLVVVKKEDAVIDALTAGAFMAKYASIILLEKASLPEILALLTLRQNIYSDPQKPLQVEPKIYPIGAPNQASPLLVTTNFSLTYYTVLAEVEASKVSSYILSVDTEGMSVLTAWAAEKFTAEKISQAMKQAQLEQLLNHKRIIIPGYVAVMSADLEDKSGWSVLVGPREASSLTSFLKNLN
jgi:acetyl-CoA decarbonylase/synthase complex subunit gamma